MTDTPALAAIHRHADAAGAKLLLVGDHRQLAAVGAGGGMELLATAGARFELAVLIGDVGRGRVTTRSD